MGNAINKLSDSEKTADALISFGNDVMEAKYSRVGLDKLLNATLGNSTFENTSIPILMTSYSLDSDGPRTWSSFKAQDKNLNFYLRDAAGATSAAPTYFPPKETIAHDGKKLFDIDGGIFANSPTYAGISDLKKAEEQGLYDDRCEHIIIISIGTGNFPDDRLQPSTNGEYGLKYWMTEPGKLIDRMMKGVEMSDSITVSRLFNVVTINPSLDFKFAPLDNGTIEHMRDFNQTLTMILETNDGIMNLINTTLHCLTSRNVTNKFCKNAISESREANNLEYYYEKEIEVSSLSDELMGSDWIIKNND